MRKRLFLIQLFLLILIFSIAWGENNKKKSYSYVGALDIRIHPDEGNLNPPAELLLTDPKGRRVGNDPKRNKTFKEITNSSYEHEGIADAETGDPGPETAIIYIRNPIIGEYNLQVIGIKSSKYILEIRGYDCEMNHSSAEFTNVMINKNTEHHYLIRYSNKKESKIDVTLIRKK